MSENVITKDMYMYKIGLREFSHNASKLMKEGEFIVTRNGRDEFRVIIKKVRKDVEEIKNKIVKEINNDYGCGCVKVEGRPLCKTHGRY